MKHISLFIYKAVEHGDIIMALSCHSAITNHGESIVIVIVIDTEFRFRRSAVPVPAFRRSVNRWAGVTVPVGSHWPTLTL